MRATPPIPVFVSTWAVDPVTTVLAAVFALGYATGLVRVRRRGERWPVRNVLAFYVLGIGSLLVVDFGFLGAQSEHLRWAFSTRAALLLFAIPAAISLGRPVPLARLALSNSGVERLERLMASRPLRLLGNAMIPPLVTVAIFSIFLTPISGALRSSAIGQAGVTVIIPLLGLLLVLPLMEYSAHRSSFFVTVEFLIAFVELVIDAIPGILLRLNAHVLDGLGAIPGSHPFWWPSPIRDQQLSGDLLWFIAELADIPVLILLFVRWSRVDRREAKSYDDLTDEQMDALMQEHLRSRRD